MEVCGCVYGCGGVFLLLKTLQVNSSYYDQDLHVTRQPFWVVLPSLLLWAGGALALPPLRGGALPFQQETWSSCLNNLIQLSDLI